MTVKSVEKSRSYDNSDGQSTIDIVAYLDLSLRFLMHLKVRFQAEGCMTSKLAFTLLTIAPIEACIFVRSHANVASIRGEAIQGLSISP